jgi:hypothetical protein
MVIPGMIVLPFVWLYDVTGGAKSWRVAEQKRSAHA